MEFLGPTTLSRQMDRQAPTGDTVYVKSREITVRTQTMPWWVGKKGKRRQKTKNALAPLFSTILLARKLLKVILIGLRIERPQKVLFL
jgi:hypothetical protein